MHILYFFLNYSFNFDVLLLIRKTASTETLAEKNPAWEENNFYNDKMYPVNEYYQQSREINQNYSYNQSTIHKSSSASSQSNYSYHHVNPENDLNISSNQMASEDNLDCKDRHTPTYSSMLAPIPNLHYNLDETILKQDETPLIKNSNISSPIESNNQPQIPIPKSSSSAEPFSMTFLNDEEIYTQVGQLRPSYEDIPISQSTKEEIEISEGYHHPDGSSLIEESTNNAIITSEEKTSSSSPIHKTTKTSVYERESQGNFI